MRIVKRKNGEVKAAAGREELADVADKVGTGIPEELYVGIHRDEEAESNVEVVVEAAGSFHRREGNIRRTGEAFLAMM